MELSFLEIFTFLAVFHCFLLGLLILLSKFYRSPVNNYLGYSLLIISVVGLNNWFWDIGRHPLVIQFFDLPLWQFLYPVLLLIFFMKASHAREQSHREKLLLFAPFVILSFCNLILSLDNNFNLISLPVPAKDRWTFYFYKGISLLTIVFIFLFTLISFRYVFLKKSGRSNKWLKLNWIFISFLIGFGGVLESYRFVYSQKEPLTYLWVLISIFSYWFIYHGIYRFKLSNEQYEIRQLLKAPREAVWVTHEDQTQDQTPAYLPTLEELIKRENIHRNPGLSRDEVAEKLGISGGYLSQLLNKKVQKSFPDYINSYRVEDVKKMMHDPEFDKYSLLSIGLEAGFNSKSTFYASFKKETGMTPSEYKKSKKVRNY